MPAPRRLALAVAFVLTSTAARAEEGDSDLEALLAEPVVKSASLQAESARDAPATTWIISGTDLQRYGIQSIEEAVRFLGHGMTSYEYDGRMNAAFGARGYMSDNLGLHLAVLIDGNQAGGSAKTARGTEQFLLPIELVDHIELVLGPGSVIYGGSAMLGVINVVTKSATSVNPGVVVQGSAGLPGDAWAKDLSWGEAWLRAAAYGGTSFQLAGDTLNVVWHLSGRWDRQEGRSRWKPLNNGVDPFADPLGAYTREDVFNRDVHTKLFARATWGHWTLMGWVGIAAGQGTGPIEGTGASTYLEPEYGLDVAWTRHVGKHGDLSLRAYAVIYDSRATTPTTGTIDPAACQMKVGTDVCYDTLHYLNFRPYVEPTFSWDWTGDRSHVTTLGAQAYIDGSVITTGSISADGLHTQSDDPIVAPLIDGALYAQHIWRGKYGVLNAGLRGDYGVLGSAVSPRIAYTRDTWEGGTAKVLFSTGFRMPAITERYLEIPHFLTSNPDIQPERVYSAEIDFNHRVGRQNIQLAGFGTYYQGLIGTHTVPVNGETLQQFANLHDVWGLGVNLGWQGGAGPFDWGASLNYAPGRVMLPPGIESFNNQQLAAARLDRRAIDEYGQQLYGAPVLPADAMADFYAIAHASVSLGVGLPRLSVAFNLTSPKLRVGYASNGLLIDPRNVDGVLLPWSVYLRGGIEQAIGKHVLLRVLATGSSLTTTPDGPRVGNAEAPSPRGGLGAATNPIAPLSVMAEVHVRL
jgi:outer membrane receptor protein involved in Fe transport